MRVKKAKSRLRSSSAKPLYSPFLDNAMAEVSAVDAADVLVTLGNVGERIWPPCSNLRDESCNRWLEHVPAHGSLLG